MNRRRTFNICLTVVITAAFILLGAFVFGDSYLRFGETAQDFGLSVGYYFCTLFGLDHDIVPSVTEYSSVNTSSFGSSTNWLAIAKFLEPAGTT